MFGVGGGRKTSAPRPSPRHGSRNIALSLGQQFVHGDVLITPRRKKRRKVSFTQLGSPPDISAVFEASESIPGKV